MPAAFNRPRGSASAFPRIVAVEVAVELNGGDRGMYRLEDPEVAVCDIGEERDGRRRIRFDVEGRAVPIGSRFGGGR